MADLFARFAKHAAKDQRNRFKRRTQTFVILAGQSQSTGLIDRLTFMRGNGDGTFSPGANIDFGPQATTGGFPAQIFAGDFNGDHKLDLIVSVYDGTYGPGSRPHPVFELFGNGDGTFQQPVTIFPDLPLNAFFALADLNHDGKLDLAAPDFTGVAVNVLLGNGAPGFAAT